MSIIKSFSVGNGDMFYIRHNADSFSIIDCCLNEENKATILKELKNQSRDKTVKRFISTHPDDDHIRGLEYLSREMPMENFYCVRNATTKKYETIDFKRYCLLKESRGVFYLEKGCRRYWMNMYSDEMGSAGITLLWPITSNVDYKRALLEAAYGGNPNNISPIIQYSLKSGVKVLWMGDLGTEFMESIKRCLSLPKIDILFAPHHGRRSGRVPRSWLNILDPKIVVIGEGPSEHLDYYSSYNTIKQNSSGSLLFDCGINSVHVYVENPNYEEKFLCNLAHRQQYLTTKCGLFYVGTLFLQEQLYQLCNLRTGYPQIT